MSIEPGTYTLGPKDGILSVRTGKHGPAARAGHNLLIEVGAWSASLQVGADAAQTALELTADSRSLRVLDGTGGVHGLSDDDKASIVQTIDHEVLAGTAIAFRSASAEGDGRGRLIVTGDLELSGRTRAIAFELSLGDDGHLTGRATVKQSEWGIRPYSTLFGTLKVNDEVEVEVDARLTETADRGDS
jgi:hypothetical protein